MMTDIELTRALERGEIPVKDFHHATHLHVAWTYLSESSSPDEAAQKMRETLRRFTAAAGRTEKYHETLTFFWMRLLGQARGQQRRRNLEQVVHAYPGLLEKNFALAYYSRDRLCSDKARACWVEPDLKPLNLDATADYPSRSPGHPPHRALS
jgi:hypothetical protein